ncbi:MAG: tetratricopeptide repeat protein, partial [bacterium]
REAAGRIEPLRGVIERFPRYLTPRVALAYALHAEGRGGEAGRVLEAAGDLDGHPLVAADRHALLGALALDGLYFARAIEHYRAATERAPETARHFGGLARACVERGAFGPARQALERQLELAPDSYDLGQGPAEQEGEGVVLEPRLEPGDVLRYRYATDGGLPGEPEARVEFRYVIEAVQPGGLVEATLEPEAVTGRLVEGGRAFARARLAVTCSGLFGLVGVGQPAGGPPREFAQLLWLVQFVHGPALPAPRWPGQRWQGPAWTELGRLYSGPVRFDRLSDGQAHLTRRIAYEKPAREPGTAFEVMAVQGEARLVFDLGRRVLARADVTTQVTMRDAAGSVAELPPWSHRLELLGVEGGGRPAGRRRVIAGVPYIRQVGPKCAAAALAMVFRRFGREVDQEQLFAELRGRSGGVHVHSLPPAAARRGFDAHPHIGTLATLKRQLTAGVPVILFLTPMGMGHAVVAIGFDDARGEIVIHDPATAPFKRVATARLEREWRESDRTALAVVPRGDRRFAGLDYPRQEAVEAMLEGDREVRQGHPAQGEAAYRKALELFPGYTEAHLALVRSLVAQKRLDAAAAETDRLLADRPDLLSARIAKADILVLQRKHAAAITIARGVEARDPTNLRNLNVLATACVRSGQRDQAVAVLERAVRMAPAWTNVRVRLASLYYLAGRYDSAAAQYRAALGHEPRNAGLHYLLAQTLHRALREDRRRELPWPLRRQHAAEAIAALEAVRDIEGPSCETSAELAQLYDLFGNGPRHIALLRRSVRELSLRQIRQRDTLPTDADPFSFLGSVSAALRSAVGRVAAWARSQRERSTNLNNLAWAFATRGEHLDEARRLAVESVALAERGFNLDTLAWIDFQRGDLEAARRALARAAQLQDDPVIHIHLGLTHLRLGHEDKADEHLRLAFEQNAPAVEVHLELAAACAQAGMTDRELEALEAAVAADPRHRLARYRLATALLARDRDLSRVRAVAEALHRADPEHPLYAGLLGAVAHLDGKAHRARRLLARAVTEDPVLGPEPVAPWHYFRGRVLQAAGEPDDARAALRRYLALAPRGPFAASARAALGDAAP